MSIFRLDSSTNPIHLVTPSRVIVPMPKPFDSPPGVMPFHRMLEAQNLAAADRTPSSNIIIPRQADRVELTSTADLLPKLGELPPLPPETLVAVQIQQTQQVQLPATGRLLDIYL